MKWSGGLLSLIAVLLLAYISYAEPSENGIGLEAKAPQAPPCKSCGLNGASGGGPYACPLFPIMALSYGTIYYCDYYDPDCNAEPEAAYVVGDFDFPTDCPDCVAVQSRADMGTFAGLSHAVSLQNAGGRFESGMSASRTLFGEAYAITDQVAGSYRAETAGLIRLAADDGEHYAAVLKIEFMHRSSHRWDTRYVALEVEPPANDDEGEVEEVSSPERLPGGLAYRATFADGGKDQAVLVLLARAG